MIFTLILKSSLVLAKDNEYITDLQLPNINQWTPVLNSTLASLRGGFMLPNGVIVDISFEKQVLQNGIETFNSYFQLPENFVLAANEDLIVTSGLDNTMIQSVIQNSLDNQILQTINSINIDIKNLNNVSHAYSKIEFYTQFVLPNTHQ